MNDHPHFMQKAIDKTREGIERGQTPFGACLVKDGEVAACEHNQVWDHTDITAHAEIQAIRTACRRLSTVDLSGTVIYSTCEPCPMCFSACHWARIDTIVYGAHISDAADAGFNEMPIPDAEMKERSESPIALIPDVLHDACVELFEIWADRADARDY